MQSPILPSDCLKIFERLFVFVDTKDAQQNTRLQLVVNPEIIKILLKQVDPEPATTKLALLQQLSALFAANPFNSLILAKRDREIIEFNHSILESLLAFALALPAPAHPDPHQIADLLLPFLTGYPAQPRVVKCVLSCVARDFHEGKLRGPLLTLSMLFLQQLLAMQGWDDTLPQSYFGLYGQETGLRMVGKNVKWPFSKGFHLYLKFQLQDTLTEDLTLFTLAVEHDDFVLYVTPEAELRVKIFGQTQPLVLTTLPRGQWLALSLSYTLRSKLLRNFYELFCTIDGEIHERRDLPVPSISMGDEIVQLTLGHSFYGKLHLAVLSRGELITWNKLVLNSWTDIESFLTINKRQLREVFLLYHPLLTTAHAGKELAYDLSSQNHAEMYDNTLVHANPFKSVEPHYYGGLYAYLPFLHLLKFYPPAACPQALSHALHFPIVFFSRAYPKAEEEALHCQFFPIASQLINECPPAYLTPAFLDRLRELDLCILQPTLRRQFFACFLWKLSIRRIEDPSIVQGIMGLIEQQYLRNFEWSYALFGLEDIFHYVIDQLEPLKSNECCDYHARLDPREDPTPTNAYLRKTNTLNNLLKLVAIKLMTVGSTLKGHLLQLLFENYSPCLKLMLLRCLREGVRMQSAYYIRQCNILSFLQLYLQNASLPEEIAVATDIFQTAIQQDDDNYALENNAICTIANVLDRLYAKKCDARERSNSDRLRVIRTVSERKNLSEQKKREKKQKPKPKPESKGKLQSNRQLYDAIVRLCFEYDGSEQQWLLRKDDYVLVLQPYFKLCGLELRRNLINMVRNTVILASKGKSIMANLTSFDRLYRLLLAQFVLRELEPDQPEYSSGESSGYVMRNVYFVVDYMVMGMRNDWTHLYLYLLRLVALLGQAQLQVEKNTRRNAAQVDFAARLSLRKFVLRVVKLAEKDVHNLPNLVFLVYLVVFSNSNTASSNLFPLHPHLEKYLFAGPYLLAPDALLPHKELAFVDSRLILETVNSFRICTIDLSAPKVKLLSLINSYLDLQYTHEESDLYKNRLIYLIKAQFKTLRTDRPFRDLIGGFLGDSKEEDVSIGEVVSLMLSLCIESAVATKNEALLKESTKTLLNFFLPFLLLCSRDGLKKERHAERNNLPLTIASNLLHFLYEMLNSAPESPLFPILEDCLYSIFYFLGLLITCLYDKLGHPDTFEKALQLASILRNVEQYHFFTCQLLQPVLTLKDTLHIPNIDHQKVIGLIHHPKLTQHFSQAPPADIESKIHTATSIHKNNVVAVKREVEDTLARKLGAPLPDRSLLAPDLLAKTTADYLRSSNLAYRKTQRIWRKIWKRLRLFHLPWAVGMDQRESYDLPYQKHHQPSYRHKFSKLVDSNGARPILEVEPVDPWHVKKVLLEKEFEYRSANYLCRLHQQAGAERRQRSLLQRFMLRKNENQSVFLVDWIKNNSKRKGHLSIQSQKLRFKYLSTYQKDSHLQFTSFVLAEHRPIEKFWPLVEITDILERRYLAARQCLLLELQDHTSLIFHFPNADKDDFLRLIEAKQAERQEKQPLMRLNRIAFHTRRLPSPVAPALEEATALWRNHRISTFKYLMLVNKLGGRSYLDPANYPVFPWIIASYNCKQYTLRDLTKTVGALGSEQRVEFYRAKLEATDPFDPVPPYQFGTHYSSPGVVFNFLVRLQPYTQASRNLQGGKFDLSDRLFSSLRVCWHSVTSQVSDVRELIPEFFYLPDCLLNIQQLDLGLTQQKERVHNVALPIWAASAYHYISLHRRQLQSDYVSEHLPAWLDLVFGCKQRGKPAEQNLNLFYYLTYEDGIDLAAIDDPQTKISREAQIMHFGQTPAQLFTKPHPPRTKLPKRPPFPLKKVTLLVSLEGAGVRILGKTGQKLLLFVNYGVVAVSEEGAVEGEGKLLRNNSRENIYFTEEADVGGRILLLGGKFVILASYVNGDLMVYLLPEAKRVQEKRGPPKSCIFVNAQETLLFCGCKNGLLEVYEIVYGEKDSLTLLRIAAEYYMGAIADITEGGGFYCVTAGSLAVVVSITRSLTYVYDKLKMKGIKLLRSIEAGRRLTGSLLCLEPVPCLVVFTPLELHCYSINGQLLASRQGEMLLPPQKLTDDRWVDHLALLEDKQLSILSTPFLERVRVVALPNKTFTQMRFMEGKCFLITNFGEVLVLTEPETTETD